MLLSKDPDLRVYDASAAVTIDRREVKLRAMSIEILYCPV
jgi:hypothetical protein